MKYTPAITLTLLIEIVLIVILMLGGSVTRTIGAFVLLLANIVLFLYLIAQPKFTEDVWFTFVAFILVCGLVIATVLGMPRGAVIIFSSGTLVLLALATIIVNIVTPARIRKFKRIEVPYKTYEPVVEEPKNLPVYETCKEPERTESDKRIEKELADVKREEREIKNEIYSVREEILRKLATQKPVVQKTIVQRTVVRKQPEITLVASKTGSKFHDAECMALNHVSKDNRIMFKSKRAALTKGYAPCKVCIPYETRPTKRRKK